MQGRCVRDEVIYQWVLSASPEVCFRFSEGRHLICEVAAKTTKGRKAPRRKNRGATGSYFIGFGSNAW